MASQLKVYDSDEAKLRVYRHRLRHAEKEWKEFKPTAEDWLRRYANDVLPEQIAVDGHRIAVPKGTSVIDTLYSALTSVNVEFSVRNKATGTRDEAYITEQALNAAWEEAEGQEAAEDAHKDALLLGIGWVKVGYDYEEQEVEVPRSDGEIADDVDRVLESSLTARVEPPSPSQIADLIPRTKKQRQVKRDRVVIDSVGWDELRWDATATSTEKVRWYCQVTRLPLDEVREDARFVDYTKAQGTYDDLLALRADTRVDEQGGYIDVGETDSGEDDDLVTVYEFWDLDAGTVCTFTKNSGFILNEAPNPFAFNEDLDERSPFVPLVLRKDRRHVRGISEMKVIEASLDELNLYRSNIANFVARYKPKMLAPRGLFTEQGREALKSQEAGTVVELEDGRSADEAKPMDPPVLPQDVFALPQQVESDILDATGANELIRGLFPDRRRTATETAAVEQFSQSRQSEKRNASERFYLDVARRVLQLMQMFYDQQRISTLVESSGDAQWQWNKDDLLTEAKLSVALTPKETPSRQERRDFAVSVVNLLAPMPITDLSALAEWMLQEAGLRRDDITRIIKTPEEVQAEQQAQQQQDLANQAQSQAVSQGMDPQVAAALAFSRGRPADPLSMPAIPSGAVQ